MKKAAIAMLIGSTLAMAGCQQEAADPLKVEQVQLQSDAEKQAYALGAGVGGFIEQKLAMQEELGIELDRALLLKGFVAGIQGQSQMTQEELQALAQALDASVREAQQVKSAAEGEKNKADGEAYLAENAKREGVVVTDSGLQYEVLTAGEGDSPGAQDTVKVHYRGTLIDGTEFDSSYSRGEPAVFPLHRVISGWTEGVQLMKEGAKYKFFIPSELAYGERSTGKIGTNSTLVFEVELLEVVKSAEEATD
ncbi:FKBP-type peptidyl-prolyl cis-trans isomerase [Aestuariibacter halophilus]|uniref:Peptidyl-prolyl cis-trans isomerase n=2 Tax=Fluctibacter halophilus TaxID=226011 RepID=A0ABS8G935_9ALTE|nr:FKBP-type peptidyl-prolyl cis-trans isomerase [Aestuariibacter halophilus]